jgi:hypothetical protein
MPLLVIAILMVAAGLALLLLGFWPVAVILCGIALLIWFVNVDRDDRHSC